MEANDTDDSLPGQDSFIDVVCNMVGILIILVMIVGVRASRAVESPSSEASSADADPAQAAELDATLRLAGEAQEEIEQSVAQITDLSVQAVLTETRRQQLSVVQAAVEQEIAERRSQLDAQGQRKFDVQRAIAEAEIKLQELTQEQVSLVSQTPDVEEVECVPTPLARTVEGDEIHARIKKGLLAIVPADQLMDEVRRRGGDYLRDGLRNRGAVEDVYGPIDGFRMRLSVERHTATLPGPPGMPAAVQATIVLQGTFLPISEEIGQTIEQSLLPGSPLMRALRAKRATSPALTVWVYPDSYGELRSLKRAMWEAGVPLAIRPLPDGQPIVFSTAGTKSNAQ